MAAVKDITMDEIDRLTSMIAGEISVYQIRGNVYKVLYYSPGMPGIHGMPEAEYRKLLEYNAADGIMDADRLRVYDVLQQGLTRHKEMECCYRARHKKKGYIWAHARAREIGMMEGYPVVLVNFSNTMAEMEFYGSILDYSLTNIFIYEKETHHILYMNEAAQTHYNLSPQNIYGQLCYRVFYGRSKPCPWCALTQTTQNTMSVVEHYDKERQRWVRVMTKPGFWFGRQAFVQFVDDITEQKQKEEQFHSSLQEMLTVNPQALCLFQLNMSENICGAGNGVSFFLQRALQAARVDELFDNISRLIVYESDRSTFQHVFQRQRLIRKFFEGRCSFFADYRRYRENGQISWIRTYINLLQNPRTNDVEGVIYSLDISEQKREEMISHVIMNKSYDYVALLYADEGQIEFIHLNDTLLSGKRMQFNVSGRRYDYNAARQYAADTWIDQEDRKPYLVRSAVTVIRKALDTAGYYELSLRGHYENRADFTMCRKIQYYYLNDEKNTILIMQTDVTKTYQEQLQQTEYMKAEADLSGIFWILFRQASVCCA